MYCADYFRHSVTVLLTACWQNQAYTKNPNDAIILGLLCKFFGVTCLVITAVDNNTTSVKSSNKGEITVATDIIVS